MFFECGCGDQDSLVLIKRHAPFDRLRHFRANGVDELTDASQNWFRKVGGPGDVNVNARVWLRHGRRIIQSRRFSSDAVAFALFQFRYNLGFPILQIISV